MRLRARGDIRLLMGFQSTFPDTVTLLWAPELGLLPCPDQSDHDPNAKRRAIAGLEELPYPGAPSQYDGAEVDTALRGRPVCWQCLALALSREKGSDPWDPPPTYVVHPPYGWRTVQETQPRSRRLKVRWWNIRPVRCRGDHSPSGRPACAAVHVWLGDEAAGKGLGIPVGEDLGPLCWACVAAAWPAVVAAEGTLRLRACLPEDRSWEDPLGPQDGG